MHSENLTLRFTKREIVWVQNAIHVGGQHLAFLVWCLTKLNFWKTLLYTRLDPGNQVRMQMRTHIQDAMRQNTQQTCTCPRPRKTRYSLRIIMEGHRKPLERSGLKYRTVDMCSFVKCFVIMLCRGLLRQKTSRFQSWEKSFGPRTCLLFIPLIRMILTVIHIIFSGLDHSSTASHTLAIALALHFKASAQTTVNQADQDGRHYCYSHMVPWCRTPVHWNALCCSPPLPRHSRMFLDRSHRPYSWLSSPSGVGEWCRQHTIRWRKVRDPNCGRHRCFGTYWAWKICRSYSVHLQTS